ncbi:MAG: diacylglycerol kinase family protein [Pseudomonadota bacterium]
MVNPSTSLVRSISRAVYAESLLVNHPLCFVVNPRAGKGKCQRFANELEDVFRMFSHSRVLPKPVRFLETNRDPSLRVKLLADAIAREGNPILVGLGGDGTTAILAEAHLKAKELGHPSIVIPGGGGTAGDMRRELGAPNWKGDAELYARSLLKFLSVAKPIELNAFEAACCDQTRTIIHSLGLGFSGGLFDTVDKIRDDNLIGVPTYLKALFLRLFQTSSFYVSINDSSPLKAAEVLMLANSTIIGSVATLPLKANTARVHVVPADASLLLTTGVAPLVETLFRSLFYFMGFTQAINPNSELSLLSHDRMFDIGRGESLSLKFLNNLGERTFVKGISNGDPIRADIDSMEISWKNTVNSLALPGSRFMYRHLEHRLLSGQTPKMFPPA